MKQKSAKSSTPYKIAAILCFLDIFVGFGYLLWMFDSLFNSLFNSQPISQNAYWIGGLFVALWNIYILLTLKRLCQEKLKYLRLNRWLIFSVLILFLSYVIGLIYQVFIPNSPNQMTISYFFTFLQGVSYIAIGRQIKLDKVNFLGMQSSLEKIFTIHGLLMVTVIFASFTFITDIIQKILLGITFIKFSKSS